MPSDSGVILLLGHRGLAGSSIHKKLYSLGLNVVHSDNEDLRNPRLVEEIFLRVKPDVVINCAATVGSVFANKRFPVHFLINNLQIEMNIAMACIRHGVRRVFSIASSTIYSQNVEMPCAENQLWSGPLSSNTKPYALAKLVGLEISQIMNDSNSCSNVSLIPSNLYGPRDNFDLDYGHSIPALIRRFFEATIRGDASIEIRGEPKTIRDFLFVEDFASAIETLLLNTAHIGVFNVSTSRKVSLETIVEILRTVSGFDGLVLWNESESQGEKQKVLSNEKIVKLGWQPRVSIEEGIAHTYDWFKINYKNYRKVASPRELFHGV